MTHKKSIFPVLCLIVLLQIMAVIPAGAEHVSLTNKYISVHLGKSGSVQQGQNETPWPIAGRWAVTAETGDPETVIDDGYELIHLGSQSPAHMFGAFKIKVGQDVYTIGDTTNGHWTELPVAYPVPRPGLGLGSTGGYIQATWETTTAATITVKIRMSLVRDQARFEFTITNNSVGAQSVGLAMLADATVDDVQNTGGYVFIPGTGAVLSEVYDTYEAYGQFLTGASVPNIVEMFDNLSTPNVVARSTFGEQDAVRPNHLAVGDWSELSDGALWLSANAADLNNWRPNQFVPVNNLAWLACWSEKRLERGASRKIVTYYGMGAASASWTSKYGYNKIRQDSAVLAVQGPRALAYNSVLAPASVLSPQTFQVKAYVYNLATDPGEFKLDDVTAYLYLPAGLKLLTGQNVVDNDPVKSIGSIANNSESDPISWTVEATGERCGELTYYVIARSSSGWQQIVARKVLVPATRSSVFFSGWQLMSVPFQFNNPFIDHVFSPLTLGEFSALYYHPIDAPDYANVTQIKPGQGFWMYVDGVLYGQPRPFTVQTDAAVAGEVNGTQMAEQYVSLETGWNMIGNPFVYPIYWGQVQVHHRSYLLTLSLDGAVNAGWINKTLFAWSPERQSYENFKTNDAVLMPWKGYWVYAKTPVTLVFRPAVFPGADVSVDPGGF